MRKYREYGDEDLIQAVKNNTTLAGVLKELNLKVAGGNYDHLRKNIAKLNLDISHFTGKVWAKGQTLKEWSQYKNNSGKKKLLIEERGYACERCRLNEWQNVPIVLEMHHINGNRLDNRKENLQLLCCNCHSITNNWKAKNKCRELLNFEYCEILDNISDGVLEENVKKVRKEKVKKELTFATCKSCGIKTTNKTFCSTSCYSEYRRSQVPKVLELLDSFKIYKNYCAVGRHYGVSDNAVRKWVTTYGIESIIDTTVLNPLEVCYTTPSD